MNARVVSTFSLVLLLGTIALGGQHPKAAHPKVATTARADPLVMTLATDRDAQAEAKRIKASPLYADNRVTGASWLSRAMEGFWNWLSNLFQGNANQKQLNLNPPSILGKWVIYAMWTILAGLVAFFVWLALKHFQWRFNLQRKSRALLEEDEPERTLDEWLERANALEAEGRYREAVRCLYLACLLRFDEARIARFDRGQTNWEHLGRIEASPNLPKTIDFRPPTLAFDRIWYGMHTRGVDDVQRFRTWYAEITSGLMEKAA